MSIRIEIIGDTMEEIASSVLALAATMQAIPVRTVTEVSDVRTVSAPNDDKNLSVVSVHTVDTNTQITDSVTVEAADTGDATPEPLTLEQMLPILSNAYRNGLEDMRAKILELRDSLGLKLLSHAKGELHAEAFRQFIHRENLQ